MTNTSIAPPRLLVTTSSGASYIREGRSTITRVIPDERRPTNGDWTLAQLRRDGEPVQIIDASEPAVGERWLLTLQIRDDGAPTLRITTPVVSIEAVPHLPEASDA